MLRQIPLFSFDVGVVPPSNKGTISLHNQENTLFLDVVLDKTNGKLSIEFYKALANCTSIPPMTHVEVVTGNDGLFYLQYDDGVDFFSPVRHFRPLTDFIDIRVQSLQLRKVNIPEALLKDPSEYSTFEQAVMVGGFNAHRVCVVTGSPIHPVNMNLVLYINLTNNCLTVIDRLNPEDRSKWTHYPLPAVIVNNIDILLHSESFTIPPLGGAMEGVFYG